MSRTNDEKLQRTTDISTLPANPPKDNEKLTDENKIVAEPTKKKKSLGKSLSNFVYDPRKKTIFGRTALNWAKLAGFYTTFYFCLGCFFVCLLYLFALITDRHEPKYFNTESTMAVRTTHTVVGMGFRPQPLVDDNLIKITDNENQQKSIARSLEIYRDVFLLQRPNARVENCSVGNPAVELPPDVACAFDWNSIVTSENHPCSDKNLFGFKNQEPCVLVKLNKVYDWIPGTGHLPVTVQKRNGFYNEDASARSDVYITCAGSNPVDTDVLTDMVFYSLGHASGIANYGVIPYYYFPYRNARDHVQPFVLVQFKNLPSDRLISVTCKVWAPGIEHDVRGMRGMVSFQLYREHSNLESNDRDD